LLDLGSLRKGLLRAALPVALFFITASCVRDPVPAGVAEEATKPTIPSNKIQSAAPSNPIVESKKEPAASESVKKSAEEKAKEETKAGKKIDIPVVEPREGKPRKVYLEPTVRVMIFGESSLIRLGSKGALALSFGENTMKVAPGSLIQFKPRSARVGVRSFTVGIATYEADEYNDAVTFAETWKREGYTVRLIKAGGPLVQADGSIADTTVYWVALGVFKEKESAEKFKDKMFQRGISCWVIDESVLGPRGNIEMTDAKGHPRAYADSRVTIASTSPITIFDVPFGNGFWDSGNREDRSFLSPIEVIIDKKGMLAVINEVKLEEYIKGVLPVEIRLKAPDETMKAQAVSARTESLAKLGIHHVYDPYDFCASQHCQEFGGLARRTRRTDAAVNNTRGQVLMRDGSLVDAVYSANCGGHTENNENVWSSRPDKSLRGVPDLHRNPGAYDSPIPASQLNDWLNGFPFAYCADSRASARHHFRWKVRYSAGEIDSLVSKHRNLGSIRDIKVLQRGISGRAMRIKIVGSRDIAIINKELQIRRVLGGLKSSMFIVDIKRDSSGSPTSFEFIGGGWGHGVGMCQSGAEGMAYQGFRYREILSHYYSGGEIRQLYD